MGLRASLASFWKSRRFRIAFYAILTGVVSGSLNLLLPAEDAIIDVRSLIRRQPAPRDIVVVAIDDKTLAALGTADVSRSDDATLVRNLMKAGARRIYFDRRYQFPKRPQDDAEFQDALRAHKGSVFLAIGPGDDDPIFGPLSILPGKAFRDNAELVGIAQLSHPLGLMVSAPLKWPTTAGVVPSMGASIAGRDNGARPPFTMPFTTGMPPGFFRSDLSYDEKSIPRISYIDVTRGKLVPATIAGNTVVVGVTSDVAKDRIELPFHGLVPGVYGHVLAAHTFRKPLLMQLGWLPAMILVSIVIISGMGRGRSFDRYRVAGLTSFLAAGPLLLDGYGIEVEVMPAILTAGVAIIRARALDRMETASEVNVASGLPSLQSLRAAGSTQQASLIALKVRNYSAIVGSFDSSVEVVVASEIVRRIRISEATATVYHEGDRFLWLSRLENPVDLFEHLEGLHRLVQNGLSIEGREIDLSFNCGVEIEFGTPIARRMANALQAAEQAVREDELVCVYDPTSNEIQWEISLLSALDRAIDRGEVWVAYQPKMDLRSGAMKGAEALARWTHPERGPISPDKFIRIAEEYHRIERITQFVLDDAVRTAARAREFAPGFTVSVNISAQLLRYPGLPKMIFDALEAQGMGPDCLILEITETDRLDRSSKTFEMMTRLVESGLELSIDDFGTGNATIDYLRYLPAKEVKIDKVFVGDMTSDLQDRLLVQSIIEMAHSLGRRVVAEGVENKDIMMILERLGCDQVQGYHISRPVRWFELEGMLESAKVRKSG